MGFWGSTGSSPGGTAPPQIPAPAAKAGFTTQALNADFTSPAYANKNTFVQACGASTGLLWYWAQFFTTTNKNCADISITQDTGVSPNLPQVLLINYPTTEGNVQATAEAGFTWPNYIGQPNCGTGSITGWSAGCLPSQMYIEAVFRTDDASWNQNTGAEPAHINFYITGLNYDSSGNRRANWFEVDFQETTGAGTGLNGDCGFTLCQQTNLVEGSQSGPGQNIVNYYQLDVRGYHKFGMLVTSDGTSAYYLCSFLDDQILVSPCRHLTPLVQNILTQHDNVIVFELDWFNNATGPGPNNIKLWIQYVRVWECANYQTASCTGTMVTQWP